MSKSVTCNVVKVKQCMCVCVLYKCQSVRVKGCAELQMRGRCMCMVMNVAVCALSGVRTSGRCIKQCRSPGFMMHTTCR